MSDIPSPAFENQLSDESTYERPTKDAYGNILTDSERQQLLNLPTPLLSEAIAETVLNLPSQESKQPILQRMATMGMRGEKLSPLVEEFLNYSQGEKKTVPFLGGADYEYLSVFCGFISGVRIIKENRGESETNQVLDNLKANVEQISNGNPQQNELMSAVELVRTKSLQ